MLSCCRMCKAACPWWEKQWTAYSGPRGPSMYNGNCSLHNRGYVHTPSRWGGGEGTTGPCANAHRQSSQSNIHWPQRDVPWRVIAYLQLTCAAFSSETSTYPCTETGPNVPLAHLPCTRVHKQHVLFYCSHNCCKKPTHLPGAEVVSLGHTQPLSFLFHQGLSGNMGWQSEADVWVRPAQGPTWGGEGHILGHACSLVQFALQEPVCAPISS